MHSAPGRLKKIVRILPSQAVRNSGLLSSFLNTNIFSDASNIPPPLMQNAVVEELNNCWMPSKKLLDVC